MPCRWMHVELPDENTMAISWEREPKGMVEWLDVMMSLLCGAASDGDV